MSRLSKATQWLRDPLNVISVATLVCSLGYAHHYLARTLSRLWFFSSDEYVIIAEIIRFSQLDFRQHFFDNPGTFFMLLNAPLWVAHYGVSRLTGATASAIGPFTFDHLPELFHQTRACTLAFFLASVVLTFAIGARRFNTAAGATAALLLAMSPVYSGYTALIRTESLALVCVLGAVLLLLDGEKGPSDAPPRITDRPVLAGILVGLAAGARLHSITAALPILCFLLWSHAAPRKGAYPRWILQAAKYLLPLSWALSAMAMSLARRIAAPGARRFVIMNTALWVVGSIAAAALYAWPRSTRFVTTLISPAVIKLGIGVAAGGVLGNPTVFPQYAYFLQSVEMYDHYRDFDRMQWPFWTDAAWYVKHYVNTIAPDAAVLFLLVAGSVWILVSRDRKALPFLGAAALFFVSKPITLIAAPHHAILWLPFFFLVCAYPVASAAEWLRRRGQRGRWAAAAALAIAVAAAAPRLTPGPRLAADNAAAVDIRLRNIAAATEWLKTHTEPGSLVAVSYFCFNPGAFYTWLRSLEVPVPESAADGREYTIWWGNRSTLAGKDGYACATRSDISSMKTRIDQVTPGEGTNPYTEPAFTPLRSFGAGAEEVDLFRFDYRGAAR